jgi:hypothetical protein
VSAATVTIDRAEFEEVIVSLGALAGFADRVYAAGCMESMLWNETLEIQKLLLEYAGLPTAPEDDDAAERRYERENVREKALLEKYVAGLKGGEDA